VHAVDLIRKKRDGEELTPEEISFLVSGATAGTILAEQLSAWLMAAWIRGLTIPELHTLTKAMRLSGEVFDPSPLHKITVDKHSSGGVGDKTSFLVAPIAAAAGLAVPMISGRALGHTGGTLDKLEAIPGYRTRLSLDEMLAVLQQTGVSIVGQTERLVPADRILYSLRDRTATVESPYLICASIMSKKLAAGLNALVLDVKTGSGAFLKRNADGLYLSSLMVEIGEAAGTRTVALLTEMGQPLGRMAGNWLEIWESIELLQNRIHPLNTDLYELSLQLAGWMIHLGGKEPSPQAGYAQAKTILKSGAAYRVFCQMIAAQGGDVSPLANPATFHQPAVRRQLFATQSGYVASMDNAQVGWAVQRLGAGRERTGDSVDAHAGIEFHVKLGNQIKAGDAICTLFATSRAQLEEPEQLLRKAIVIANNPPTLPPLVHQIITKENATEIRKQQPISKH
jgi:pyrimidine-nucleoside phosphorylase